MAYKRIYAPTGEPFDVPEVRANDLILQKGWTQQPPVMASPVAMKSTEDGAESESEESESGRPKRRRPRSEPTNSE